MLTRINKQTAITKYTKAGHVNTHPTKKTESSLVNTPLVEGQCRKPSAVVTTPMVAIIAPMIVTQRNQKIPTLSPINSHPWANLSGSAVFG